MSTPLNPNLRPRLPAKGLLGRQGKPYHAHEDLVAAANVALALGRPLLLTGEAGCGKTDFAFAAELALRSLGDPADPGLLECHVRSDSRSRDLLYHYDALTRFADAQQGDRARAADPRHYIQLLPLGRALVSTSLRVVLVDEIDKAPRDLPNDLLRELDHGRFEIPEIPAHVGEGPLRRVMGRAPDDATRPLVIVTSNVERQLPDAFLRRCVFFHIRFPDSTALRQILVDRFGEDLLHDKAIVAFEALRRVPNMAKAPATAELLDWMSALTRVYDSAQAGLRLRAFAERVPAGASGLDRLPWRDLPGLACLVKLREDLDRLRVVEPTP